MPRRRAKETTELGELHLRHESESVSDLELEEILFEDASSKPKHGNRLPIVAGFGLLGAVGIYLLQEIGILPGSLFSDSFIIFPLVGLLLILLYAVLPKRRKRKNRKKKKSQEKRLKKQMKRADKMTSPERTSKWGFPPKSSKKYLAGVCGGLAQRINMDPTMFRVLFMIALIATGFTVPLIAYILFAIFMPPPDDESDLLL